MAKSKYGFYVKPRLDEIRQWVEEGFSDRQVAEKIGVSYTSFKEYKKQYSVLSDLLMNAKKERDEKDIERTERALMKAIEGGWVTNGEKAYYIPPNTTAIMFALKKWNPKKYGDNNIQSDDVITGVTVKFVDGGESNASDD